jgi:hypothetical protein
MKRPSATAGAMSFRRVANSGVSCRDRLPGGDSLTRKAWKSVRHRGFDT